MSVGSGVNVSVAGRISAGAGVSEGIGVFVEIVAEFVGTEGEEQEEIKNKKSTEQRSTRVAGG
jgi:hypothetical protein